MNGGARLWVPRAYYLVTPAFIALDYLAGVNVRVAVLDGMPRTLFCRSRGRARPAPSRSPGMAANPFF